jgi:hypothetical protein
VSDEAIGVLVCQLAAIPPRVPSCARTCPDCGVGIWVSQTMTPRIDSGGVKPLCPRCVQGFMRAQEDLVFEVAPEQTAELHAAGVLAAVDQLVAALNRRYGRRT